LRKKISGHGPETQIRQAPQCDNNIIAIYQPFQLRGVQGQRRVAGKLSLSPDFAP
jgi:hypothetical protein